MMKISRWQLRGGGSYQSKIRLALKMTTVSLCEMPFLPSPPISIMLSTYPLPREKEHFHQTIQESIQMVSKLKGICIHLLLWGNCPMFWPHGAIHTVQRAVSPDCNMCCINHLINFTSFLTPHPNANPHSMFPLPFCPFLFHFCFLSFVLPFPPPLLSVETHRRRTDTPTM